jgi:glycosyltransferase involved in cell wall biosynthesis
MLSPERDVKSLADNIRVLLTAPELSSDMSAKGRAHVEQFHDVTKEANALEDLYYELLSERERKILYS